MGVSLNETGHNLTTVAVHSLNRTHYNLTEGEFLDEQSKGNPIVAVFILYGVLFVLIGAQTGLFYWRKKHQKSYDLVTLFGLWVIPAAFSLLLHFWRFIAIWFIYSVITGYLGHLCAQKKIDRTTPRKVYTWFIGVFKVSQVFGIIGYLMVLIQLFAGFELFGHSVAFDTVWYGVYYGILCRDCAMVASTWMASGLGVEGRQLASRVNNCGICGGELLDELAPGAAPLSANEKTIQLSCKHCFHELCIRGWTMVGKKDVCPQCSEKVDLRSIVASRPWETHNLSWIQMMDGIRYLVVWNPIIFFMISIVIHFVAPGSMTSPSNDTFPSPVGVLAANHTIAALSPPLAIA